MRARNIKPGFFENEELAELEPIARLLYIGLWCYADREGRFELRPKRIKAVVMPYDDIDITSHLMSLHDMTLISFYKSGKVVYAFLPNFPKHQNPHPHEAKSICPNPSDCVVITGQEALFGCQNAESIQCHDMSVKCNADSLIPDTSKRPNVSIDTLCGEPPHSTHEANGRLPYSEIVDYLNECSGSAFRASTKSTKDMIKARFKQGFTLEDFKEVIAYKCGKWKIDHKMAPYMRPKTLFSDKFESYLNEARRGTVRERTFCDDLDDAVAYLESKGLK